MSFLGLVLVWLMVAQAMQLRSASLHYQTALQPTGGANPQTLVNQGKLRLLNGSRFEIDVPANLVVDGSGDEDWANVATVVLRQPSSTSSSILAGAGYFLELGLQGQQLAYAYYIRSSVDQTTNNALEFNQVLSTDGANPTRTVGDVLLIFTQPLVTLKTWTCDQANLTNCQWGLTWSLASWLATASTNTQTIPAANAAGLLSNSSLTGLAAGTFEEAAFNFQGLPCFLANQCYIYRGMTFKAITQTGVVLAYLGPYSAFISTCGKILANKKAALTGLPLAGATFTLYSSNYGIPGIPITPSFICTTDATGTCLLDGIGVGGPYFVRETIPPPGYSGGTYQPVTVIVGQLATVTFADTAVPNALSLAIKIEKADQNMQPLNGATFQVQGPTGPPLTFPNVSTTFCTDQYPFGLWPVDNTTKFCGTFTVTETVAPPGYSLAPFIIPGIASYQRSRSITVCYNPNQPTACASRAVDILFQDSPLPGQILVTKKQASFTGPGLAGATFGLCYDNAGKTCVAQKVTDASGNAVFNVTVFTQPYYVVELKAPPGWKLAAAQGPLPLAPGRIFPLTFLDSQLLIVAGPTISKVSANGTSLAGATFQVIGPNNVSVIFTNVTSGTFCTDDYAPQLASWPLNSITGCGTFVVTELIPPPGFQLSQPATKTITFCIPLNTVTRLSCAQRPPDVTFIDSPSSPPTGAIQIIKYGECGSLSGAVFQITSLNPSTPSSTLTVTTTTGGYACVGPLPLGNYSVQEIVPPPGFYGNNIAQVAIVDTSSTCGNTTTVVTFVDILITGAVLVVKNSTDGPLSGAVFQIQRAFDGKIWTVTTGSNGVACIDQLRWGEGNLVKEIQAPQGYSLDITQQNVQISNASSCTNSTQVITFYDTRVQQFGAIKIFKTSDCGPIGGVTFLLTQPSSLTFVAMSLVSGPDGYVCVDGLPFGSYVVQETSSILGHIPDSTPRTITVSANDNCTTVAGSIQFYNPVVRAAIRIFKQGPAGGLGGARFLVQQSPSDPGFVITTNADGYGCADGFVYGNYTVHEQTAPLGYTLSSQIQSLTLIEPDVCSNTSTLLTFYDSYQTGAIKVIKTNSYFLPLAGATFQIQQVDQPGVNWTVITDSNGVACQTGLNFGQTYSVAEIAPPPGGYVLDSTPQTFRITGPSICENTTLVASFADGLIQYGAVRVFCESATCGLPSAVFSLTGGSYSQNLTTNQNGYACLDGFLLGSSFTLTEVVAPQGYNIDPTPRVITVTQAGTCASTSTFISFANSILYGAVQISNIGSGQNLVGAQFQIVGPSVNLTSVTGVNGTCFDTLPWGQSFQITLISTATGYSVPSSSSQSVVIQQAGTCSQPSNRLVFISPVAGVFRRRF